MCPNSDNLLKAKILLCDLLGVWYETGRTYFTDSLIQAEPISHWFWTHLQLRLSWNGPHSSQPYRDTLQPIHLYHEPGYHKRFQFQSRYASFYFGYETHKFIVLYTCSDSQPDSMTHMPMTYKYAWLLVRNPSLAKSLELWSVVRTLFEKTNINSLVGPQLIGSFERNSFLPYH